jgi:putative salt-induced outer membrane protein
MVRHTALAGLFVLLTPAYVLAQTGTDVGWSGAIEINGSNTTGNNETTNIGVQLSLKNRGTDWRHDFAFTADYGEDSGNTNKERMRASYKIGRDISERSYLFLNASYFSDDFGAFKNGAFMGAGYGYDILIDEPTQWKVEAGLGFRSQKARLVPVAPTDPVSRKEEFVSARLSSNVAHSLNDNVRLTNDTELFYSDVDTYVVNETAIVSELFGGIGLRASFRIETHTDVPDGREKTDTISRLGVVYTMN